MRNIPRAARPARLAQHTRECETERMSEKHERTEATNTRILTMLSNELDLKPTRVRAAVNLLDSGSSVPFIARYRKEATGALTDTHLRAISTRLDALRALETRRENILSSLAQRREDGLIDPLTYEQLITGVGAASSKQDLEALYAPYRSERITKAQRARAAGLEALVEDLLEVPLAGVYDIAAAYVDEPDETDDKHAADAGKSEGTGITTVEEALDGARAILIDRALTDPTLAERLHERMVATGTISSRVIAGREAEGAKFADYFDFSDSIKRIRPHRVLALLRAKEAGIVRLSIDGATPAPPLSKLRGEARAAALALAENYENVRSGYEREVAAALRIPVQVLNTVDSEARVLGWLAATVRTAWRKRLHPRLADRIRNALFEMAEREAITVFASNLRDLLLAAPAGQKVTLGLDPGLRNGVKCAVIDGTGHVLKTFTVYPHAPRYDRAGALAALEDAGLTHGVGLIAIGNGTASRETDKLAAELLAKLRSQGYKAAQKVTVSEAGASVYSASELASEELPDLDVTVRGAVSIARRLPDPRGSGFVGSTTWASSLGREASVHSYPCEGHDLSLMVTVTEPPETGWTSFQVRSPCFHSFPPTLTFSIPSSDAFARASWVADQAVPALLAVMVSSEPLSWKLPPGTVATTLSRSL